MHHKIKKSSGIFMRNKEKRITKIRLLRLIPLLLLCPLSFPVNCYGRNFKWNKTLVFPLPKDEHANRGLNYQYLDVVLTANRFSKTESETIVLLIHEYLNNLSPVKECILMYLCQDVCKIFILLVWILYFAALHCLVVSDGTYLGPGSAKLFSFLWMFMSHYLLLILNSIGAIKLYVTKELKLDPPMPWNQDEYVVFKRVKLISMLLSFAFVSSLFGTEGYPMMYFKLIGDKRSFSQLPTMTSINSGVILALLFSYLLMLLASKFYKTRLDMATQPRFFSEKAQSWFLVVACLLGVGICAGFVLNMYGGGNIWIALFLYQLKTTVFTPIFIIYFTPELKTYVKCTIRKNMECIADFVNCNCSKILGVIWTKRSSQIQPII